MTPFLLDGEQPARPQLRQWIGDARLEEIGDGQIRSVAAGDSRNPSRPYIYAVIWPPFGGSTVFQDLDCCDDAGLIRVDDHLRAG